MFSKKCEVCKENKLPKDPFIVELILENNETVQFQSCEECARLLEVMRQKMEEVLDDESI